MLHWLKKPGDEPPLSKRTLGLLFLQSLLGNFLFTICMIYGVSLTSATSAGVIMASMPACVALMSWLFLHERIASRTWLAVGCAATGIALFALASNGPGHGSTTNSRQWLPGYALLLAASLCEAAYSVIGKKLTHQLNPKRIASLINLWGFVLTTPMGLYLAWVFDFQAVSWGMWLLLLFYALAACVWSVWLWMTGLRTVDAAQGGVLTVLLPVSAALVGVLALGEHLNGIQIFAFGIALLSVLLATLPAHWTLHARITPGTRE